MLLAGTGIFASILSDTNPSTNFPLLMSACNYALLSTYLLRGNRFFGYRDSSQQSQFSVFDEGDAPLFEEDSVLQHDNKVVWTSFIQMLTKAKDHIISTKKRTPEDLQPLTDTKNTQISLFYWYIFAAVIDVEANFLVILAYNYSSITSIMLLDCFTIPCCMALSYTFLGCRYTSKHVAGIFICLSGLTCVVLNDFYINKGDDHASNAVLGDTLCLFGAVLYACSNVMQEYLVKFTSRNKYLGHLGGFGFSLAFLQCMIIELPKIQEATFTPIVISSIISFVFCLFFIYTNTSSFLQHGDSIIFNLSLLTSDMYAVLFTFLFHGYWVSWLYFLSFALVMVGLYVYYTETPPINLFSEDSSSSGENHSNQSENQIGNQSEGKGRVVDAKMGHQLG